jgi:excisionase family DNA binding protein
MTGIATGARAPCPAPGFAAVSHSVRRLGVHRRTRRKFTPRMRRPLGEALIRMPDTAAEILEHARRVARTRKQNRTGGHRKPAPAPAFIRPLAHTVVAAARLLGVSRQTLYKTIRGGGLRAVKHGRLTLITDADLCAYVEALPQLDLTK